MSATSRAHLTLSLLPLKESFVHLSQALMKSDGNKAVREEIPGTCRKVPWVENTLCHFLADGSDQLTGGREKMGLTWMRGGGLWKILHQAFLIP